MKFSHIIVCLTSVVFSVWLCAYFWFWEPATLTTLHWVFWLSVIGAITLLAGLILHKWTNLAYFNVIVTYIIALILLGFQIWVLYSYMIIHSIDILDFVGIVDLIFVTNNNVILPIIMIAFASFGLYATRVYSRAECRELMAICKA